MKEVFEIEESFEEGLIEEPVKEEQPDDWHTHDVEEEFNGLGDSFEEEPKTSDSTELVTLVNDDFGNESLARAEEAYEMQEFDNKVAPILAETTKKAVGEAVKYQQDRLKLEMQEVLQEEVGYRLSKYEKRRKWRSFKDKIATAIKILILIGVVGFIMGNAQLRLRIAIVAKDFGEIIEDLLNGEETSSNKLVEDLFRDLGDDLDKVNTIDENKGFDINEGSDD